MTGDHHDKIVRHTEQLYGEEVIARIKAALPVIASPELEAGLARRMRDWAVGYALWRQMRTPEFQHQIKVRQRQRSEMRDKAEAFLQAYSALDAAARLELATAIAGKDRVKPHLPLDSLMPTNGYMEYFDSVIEGVRRLAKALEASDAPKRRGRPTKGPRIIAVTALATIYIESTGSRPTLNRNPDTDENYSAFRDFCEASLAPIEGHEKVKIGLDALIRRVLYVHK